MTPILNIALRAVRQANEYIVQNIDKRDPGAADPGSDAKLLSHLETTLFQVLFDHLKRGYPSHFVCEPGQVLTEPKDDSWHIVEFDSAATFNRRLPTCTFSILHRHRGKAQNCIILNVFTGDEYTATRGSGAALNNRRIRCTGVKSIEDSLISCNLPAHTVRDSHVRKELLAELAGISNQMIITGNNVMDLSMVASGQVDLAILCNANTDQLDAAMLLCQEAGTLSGTLNGGLIKPNTTNHIVVANPKLYKSVVQRLGGYCDKL